MSIGCQHHRGAAVALTCLCTSLAIVCGLEIERIKTRIRFAS